MTEAAAKLGSIACLATLFFACMGEGGRDVNLSPGHWPERELEKFTALQNIFYEPHPLGEGRKAMVAGIQGALAVRGGFEVLKQGGNAMDAVLTTSLAQIAVQGGYAVTYAGFTTLLYYDAASGRIHTMNAAFNTVKAETDPLSIPVLGTPSGRSTLVPGLMAGFQAAHDRFGTIPFARLFEPAIYFAEQGFVMHSRLAGMVRLRQDVLSRWPESKRIFTKKNGEWYVEGDLFTQPQLAQTLKRVAAEGADYMYGGEWGRKFVETLRREDGKMTLADLEGYQVEWSDPLHTTYKDYDVFTLGPPNFGGASTLEMLNLVEEAGVSAHGHYAESPEALARLMQISRVAEIIGPPLSGSGVPPEIAEGHLASIDLSLESRVTKKTSKLLWQKMQEPGWTKLEHAAVEALNRRSPASEAEADILKRLEQGLMKPRGSDCVLAVDEQGNVAVLLHTINTVTWGDGLFVDGVSIANSGTFQQELINRTGPGVRLPDPTNPLIVMRNGKPVLASCVVGSWLAPATVQNLINVLDFGMDPKAAVDAPQFWQADPTPVGVFTQEIPEGDFSDELLEAVRAMGERITVVPQNVHYGRRGYWIGLRIDPESGLLHGGVSRYFNGYAIGY